MDEGQKLALARGPGRFHSEFSFESPVEDGGQLGVQLRRHDANGSITRDDTR
jgi:hypothetical protein